MINNVSDLRKEFPALNQMVNNKPLIYFDNAATAQKPNCVIDLLNRMNSGINGNIHRAVHELSAQSTILYEQSRDNIREYINAKEREEIIFTSGTTASVNLVANTYVRSILNKGDVVLLSEAEHHSNIVPWQLVCMEKGASIRVIPVNERGEWMLESLDVLLDKSVKFVSIAHISNVLGLLNPIEIVIEKAHKLGIPVMIDGAQGVVHAKVDVQALDCDFYAFSGHKLYGPTGTGVLYGKRELLEEMPPWMGGGDMVGSVSFKKTTYADIPLKFEAGTPNFIGASALGAAVSFVNRIDPLFMREHEESLTREMYKVLDNIDGVRLYGDVREKKCSLFSFSIDGVHPSDLAMLIDKMGVALRSGQMCCEPLMDRYGVQSMLRASLLLYNRIEEIEQFGSALKKAISYLK